MPVQVLEKFASPVVSGRRAERLYTVSGSDDLAEVRAAVLDAAPGSHEGKLRDDEGTRIEPLGPGLWEAGVVYDSRTPQPTGASSYAFDTTGATRHITQSLSTWNSYPENAPHLLGAIGFDGQQIQGVDIAAVRFDFTLTKHLAADELTTAYIASVYALTGKVNNDVVRVRVLIPGSSVYLDQTYQPGELLFRGASGGFRGDRGDIELVLQFSASPNATSLTVGWITDIEKDGWDYLWVLYEEGVSENAYIKQPRAVYVERVYERASFAPLNLDEGPVEP